MLFRQFVDEDLGCASYLVGDPAAGTAVVVDPSFRIERYVEAAAAEGVRIDRVLETHTHADHVSGHGRFALEHGTPVAIHALAEAEYAHEPLADGDVVRAGDVEVTVLHTPGHRPEHCAFLVGGSAVLTGDSLFVGDAARPDLAVAAREGAEDLFHSLRRLTGLGDDVGVFPGHVAGSLCGGHMSPERSSTIGRERATNAALGLRDLQEFILESASVSTPRPPTTERVVGLNRGPWVAVPPGPQELVATGDAVVLDVRPFDAHSEGHAPGAINVPVADNGFGTKAAFVLLPDEPFVLHARSEVEALGAAWKLYAVGLLEIAGYVLQVPVAEPAPTFHVSDLKRLVDADEVQIVDVREASERDDGYIPGSRNIPYRLLRKLAADALDPARPVATICESGPRAAVAATVLRREGFDARAVVGGGVPDFTGEIVGFRRCGS